MAEERKGVVTFKGTPLTLVGPEIKPGQPAPDVTAVDTSLQAVRLSDAKGKVLLLSSVPSLDTPVCDTCGRSAWTCRSPRSVGAAPPGSAA